MELSDACAAGMRRWLLVPNSLARYLSFGSVNSDRLDQPSFRRSNETWYQDSPSSCVAGGICIRERMPIFRPMLLPRVSGSSTM